MWEQRLIPDQVFNLSINLIGKGHSWKHRFLKVQLRLQIKGQLFGAWYDTVCVNAVFSCCVKHNMKTLKEQDVRWYSQRNHFSLTDNMRVIIHGAVWSKWNKDETLIAHTYTHTHAFEGADLFGSSWQLEHQHPECVCACVCTAVRGLWERERDEGRKGWESLSFQILMCTALTPPWGPV